MALKWLPEASWSKPQTAVVPRTTLTSAASRPEQRQIMLAAEGAALRVIYGRDRLGAELADVRVHGGYLVLSCVWGEGEIDAVESITLDDAPLPAGVQVAHYLGAAVQPIDPWLADAAAAAGETYTETRPGVAYSVIKMPATLWGQIAAVVRGRKLYDPRTGLTVFSQNAALVLADYLVSSTYGAGRAVDWASVAVAADACDQLVGGEPRRQICLTLDAPRPIEQWRDVLRTYAACWIVPSAAGLRLVPDRPASPVAHYDHAAGTIRSLSPLRLRRAADAPTVLTVSYTDTSVLPWRAGYVTAYAPGVVEGTVPRRESEVPLPGIQRAAQAYREAVERLNKLTLLDLSTELDVFDEGMRHDVGDVITLTHPRGVTNKAMRIAEIAGEAGRYRLSLIEYDAAAYSDAVTSEPSTPDTSLPSPSAPTPVIGLALTEELFQRLDGSWSSRIRAQWTLPDFPWTDHFRINVLKGGVIVQTGTARAVDLSWPSAEVQDGQTYQVDVVTVSRTGAPSAAASATLVAQGKLLPPGNVPRFNTAFEAGGRVFLGWDPAIDIDITRYELRYGLVAGAWDTARFIDRVDGLTKVVDGVPAGTWRFYIRALDSVGNYSPVPLTRDITVSLDAAAFLIDTYTFSTPVLTRMTAYQAVRGGPTWYVSDSGDGLGYGHADTDNATGTFADLASTAFAVPRSAGESVWQSESWDVGLLVSGNWQADVDLLDLAGAAVITLQLSTNGADWIDYPGVSAKASARFARLRIVTTGVMRVADGPTLRIDAAPRQEVGVVSCAASGPTTVTLEGRYVRTKSISALASGATARSVTYDNMVVTPDGTNSFDLYLFNAGGTQIAGDVTWTFEGI